MLNSLFSTVQCESSLRLFNLWHVIVFYGSFAILNYMVKHKKESEFIEKLSTIIMLLAFGVLYTWYHFSPENLFLKGLPLYTCRIVPYLFAIGIFFNNKFCIKLGSYWGFYGGIAGLIFPTIFKYPFPHVLQITTVFLHIYIMLLSGNYLFVKKIGMTKSDSKMCCFITTGLLIFNTIFNMIFDTNYTATFKMPAALIKIGINIPASLCLLAVITGYILITMLECFVVDRYTKFSLEKVKNK